MGAGPALRWGGRPLRSSSSPLRRAAAARPAGAAAGPSGRPGGLPASGPGRSRAIRDAGEAGGPVRVLFLESFAACRAALARAVFDRLARAYTMLEVESDLAVISPFGEAGPIAVDHRARLVGERLGLAIPAEARTFDELADTTGFDLVLAMDEMDHGKALQLVAAYDHLNPHGFHAVRIRRLAGYSRLRTAVAKSADADQDPGDPDAPACARGDSVLDIPDPLYGNAGTLGDQLQRLNGTTAQLGRCCRGLLDHLYRLRYKAGDGLPLRAILSRHLRTSETALGPQAVKLLRGGEGAEEAAAGDAAGPVWLAPEAVGLAPSRQEARYTVYHSGGRPIVRRRSRGPRKAFRYWREWENLERELRAWMAEHGDGATMPTMAQLSADEAGQRIRNAIQKYWGGSAGVAERLCLAGARKPAGWWTPEALRTELGAWMAEHGDGQTMPTQRELRQAGRADLINAVQAQGGAAAVGAQMGLAVRRRGRPPARRP